MCATFATIRPKVAPGGELELCKKNFMAHRNFRCAMKKYDKYDTNMTTNMTDMNNKYD